MLMKSIKQFKTKIYTVSLILESKIYFKNNK